MYVSAELRWFWREVLPLGLEAWFQNGPWPPGGGRRREDEYLLDAAQRDLGLKKRGGKNGIEVKGLVATGATTSAPFAGRTQIWCKWTSEALTIDHLPRVVVRKTRWLRKYDTSGPNVVEWALDADERLREAPERRLERGCQIELVTLGVDDDATQWWTLGFEAFDMLDRVEDSLHRTVAHLGRSAPPSLDGGLELSYPAWLARRAGIP